MVEVRKQYNGIHRDTWENGVLLTTLRKAVQTKIKFHRSRVKHWEGEREKARKKFEKHGMKLVESPQFGNQLSVATASAYTSNKVRTAEVDYDLAEKWQLYNRKVEQHKEKVREFSKWAAFLDPNACSYKGTEREAKEFDLTFADCEYFGLLGSTDPKED